MAIKISGTTVIDDSRNVTNIIGVGDTATTVFYGDGANLSGISGDRFTTITPNQTTSKTLVNKEFCLVTSAGIAITLPASPSAGNEVAVGVTTGITDTVITRNSENIMSLAEDLTIDVGNVVVTLVYSDSTRGWRIV